MDHVQHVTIGQSGTIQLGVTGFPKPSFKWMKGKTEIKPDTDARYTLRDDGSLVIGVVKKDDQGNYTCDVGQSGYLSDEHIEVYAVGRWILTFMFGNAYCHVTEYLGKVLFKGANCHAILAYFQKLNGVFASVEFQK